MKNMTLGLLLAIALAVAAWNLFVSKTREAPAVIASPPESVAPLQTVPVAEVQLAQAKRAELRTVAAGLEDETVAVSAVAAVSSEADASKNRPLPEARGTIDVLVRDATGAPVADAKVHFEPVDGQHRSIRKRSLSPATDAQGRARLTPVLGSFRLIAHADGFAVGSSETVQLTASRSTKTVELTLLRGGAVVGQLLDLAGKSAAGIRISIHLASWPGQVKPRATGSMQATVTAADGSFGFEHLPPGSHTLYTRAKASRREDVPNQRIKVEVVEGGTTVVEFEDISNSYVKLSGIVLRNGEPVPRSRINISWNDRSRGYLGKNTKADGSGRFEITLDEGGDYRFQISPPDNSGSVFLEAIVPPTQTHEIELAYSTGGIRGHVFGPDDKPVAHFPLRAMGRSADGASSTLGRATTDAGGAYEFPSLSSATYTISATRTAGMVRPSNETLELNPYLGSAQVTDLHLRAGQILTGVDLTLSAGAAIDVRSTDGDGNPVPAAQIQCLPVAPSSDRQGLNYVADKTGRCIVGGLAPGEYKVRATFERDISEWVRVSAHVQETATAELVLQRGAVIRFAVTTDGQPAARCWVCIVDEGKRIVAGAHLKGGAAEVGPLAPGMYEARADDATQIIQVAGEEELTVEFDLP